MAGLAEGEARPLSFYVENVPNAVSIDSKGKLVPLQWKKIDSGTLYPSIEKLDQNLFPGGLCVVSYLRRNSLEVGVIRNERNPAFGSDKRAAFPGSILRGAGDELVGRNLYRGNNAAA
ncbi:hypothetical protein N9173_00680 [bacterium]|nr:hypothetical protein [bacterium]